MKKSFSIALVLGMGLGIAPWASGQNVAAPPADLSTYQNISAPALAPEDQPTKEQLNKLFALMRMREQFESTIKMASATTKQQMVGTWNEIIAKNQALNGMAPEDKERLKGILSEFADQTLSIYSSDQMIEDMTGIYQRYLSRSDVDGLIAIMSSVPGQHFLEQSPVMTQELMTIVMKRTHDPAKAAAEQESKDIQELIAAAIGTDQTNNNAAAGAKGNSKSGSIVDRIEKLVAAFAKNYKPGQSVLQTLTGVLGSGTADQ
jgi:hypothetical protein